MGRSVGVAYVRVASRRGGSVCCCHVLLTCCGRDLIAVGGVWIWRANCQTALASSPLSLVLSGLVSDF